MSKEESVTTKITKAFSTEKILPQHSILSYQIDLYFPKNELTIKVDEKGHIDRDEKEQIERKMALEKQLAFRFIRTNPDAENYDIFVKTGKIQNHIIESAKTMTKKLTKRSLIDKTSKILLALEFEEDNSIRSKCLNFIVKKYCYHNKTCELIT